MNITVRHAEPEDCKAVHKIFSGLKAVAGTLQLPFPAAELWRKRLSDRSENMRQLVVCVDGELVGEIYLWMGSNPRVRHIAGFGMAVRDDWRGKGVGSALLEAALNLAENWLGITRVELQVYTDNEAGTSFTGAKIPPIRFRALLGPTGNGQLELSTAPRK